MGAVKPTRVMDWINDDSASKYTTPDAPTQLAGHVNATNADNKVFNWAWWRTSQWIEFLNDTFDSNGNMIYAPKSTTITETIAPVANTITLDSGGVKAWDASVNSVFSITEAGVVTIGYSGNDIVSLNAGALTVGTATASDLVKLHALTPSAADLNIQLGASGNGLTVADMTKLADIDASAAEIDTLDGILSSTAELNILNGVTVTYDEINYLGASGLVAADLVKLATIDASADNINRLNSGHGISLSAGNITGNAVYVNDTDAGQTAFQIDDSGGRGMQILQTATNYNAFEILDCGGHGIYMESVKDTTADCIHLDTSGVADYCRSYLYGKGCAFNGIYIDDSGYDGIRIVAPGQHGINVYTSGTSSYDAIHVANSLRNGMQIDTAANHGLEVVTTVAGDAVHVSGTGGHGVYVANSAGTGSDSIYIADSGRYGIQIADSTNIAVYLAGGSSSAISLGNYARGLVVAGTMTYEGIRIDGNCTTAGLRIAAHAGSSGAIQIDTVGAAHGFVVLTTTSGGDAIHVANSNRYGIWLTTDGTRGQMHFTPMATPSTAVQGDVYWDSTAQELKCYSGSVWYLISDGPP